MGADPEFICVNSKGSIIHSQNVVSTSVTADFGCDGNGVTFEVRPAPSKNPIEVVHNIRDIFIRQVIEKPSFLKYNWISGSFHKDYPIGGHIHFGIKNNVIAHTSAISFLDDYVGSISILLENKEDGLKRRSYDYGLMGDYREQDWGFEYRPMSSWISSPYVATAIIALSKTVMYEVLNNPKFDWHTFVMDIDFKEMRQDNIRELFPKIWSDITKMTLYQNYKPYIDLLYFLVTNKLTWLSTSSMKDSWGIIDMKKCISKKFTLDVIWQRFNLEQTITQ